MTVYREATTGDVPQLLEMGVSFLASTAYGQHVPTNRAQLATTARWLIEAPEGVVLVAERDGRLVGMIGAAIFTHPISGEQMASELFWWVEPDSRGAIGVRLLKRLEAWARRRGAVKVQMIAPTWEVEQVYSALGYARVEVAYQRSL